MTLWCNFITVSIHTYIQVYQKISCVYLYKYSVCGSSLHFINCISTSSQHILRFAESEMDKKFLVPLCILLMLLSVKAAPRRSLITHLPGFSGKFLSHHYSGYVCNTLLVYFYIIIQFWIWLEFWFQICKYWWKCWDWKEPVLLLC